MVVKKHFSIPFIVASTGFLTACNTVDHYYYSTGPWGPATVNHTYPRYTAPWGPPPGVPVEALIEEPPLYIDGSDIDPVVRPAPTPIGRIKIVLPPDPIPASPMPYGSSYSDPPSQPVTPYQGLDGSAAPAERSPSQPTTVGPPSSTDFASAPTKPSSYAGTWKAVDEKGSFCRILLSTASTLDLYKASASGCSNPDLKSVNSWNFSGASVTLYSRGKIIAQMSGKEAHLTGTLTDRSRITMTR
ncbi:AprI/Inh family metalloprotease inhibitor [Microvirga sp. 2TAF3]|uniref:AprI/Inh family metalloprotease inhibitor n=1 Tax=Microvirga sp. 2TAF3 TaxID=3233014 RepID=UPI003F9B9BBB